MPRSEIDRALDAVFGHEPGVPDSLDVAIDRGFGDEPNLTLPDSAAAPSDALTQDDPGHVFTIDEILTSAEAEQTAALSEIEKAQLAQVGEQRGEIVETPTGLKQGLRLFFGGARSLAQETKGFFTSVVRAFDAQRKLLNSESARKPDWERLVAPLTLGPETAEGELAFRQFPDERTTRVRQEAVREIEVEIMQEAGFFDEYVSATVGGGQIDGKRLVDQFAAAGMLPGIEADKSGAAILPEERIQALEAKLWERDEQVLTNLVLFAREKPNGIAQEVEREWLRSFGGGNEVEALFEKVRQINDEHGVDLDKESALIDLTISKGIALAGWDLAVFFNDPSLALGFLPKVLKPITEFDEATRVGRIPALANLIRRETTARETISNIAPAERTIETAKGIFQREIFKADKLTAKQVNAATEVVGDLIVKTKEDLPIGQAEKLIEAALKPGDLTANIARAVDNVDPNTIEKLIPLRSWLDVLQTSPKFKEGAVNAWVARAEALGDIYQATLQKRATQEQRTIAAVGKLIDNPEAAMKIVSDLRRGAHTPQKVIDGFFTYKDKDRRLYSEITGIHQDILTQASNAITDFALFEPKIVLRGTEAWRLLSNANRSVYTTKRALADRAIASFGFLKKAGPRPPAFEAINKEAREALDRNLYSALDGKKTGRNTFKRTVKDANNNILREEEITLSPEELQVFLDARSFWDELALEMAATGNKKFKPGDPISRYLDEIIDENALRNGHIPDDLFNIVGPNVYFRKALPRQMADDLGRDVSPTLSEALRVYLPQHVRRTVMGPALKEALATKETLNRVQQDYLSQLGKVIRGQPTTMERWANNAIGVGEKAFRLVPGLGKKALSRRPAYRASMAVSRAYHVALLGGMASTAMYNMGQSINTASRFGALNVLRSLSKALSKEGRAEFERHGLTDDFVEFFSSPNGRHSNFVKNISKAIPGTKWQTWDDIVMHPMHAVENLNRGIAFWTGANDAMRKIGVKEFAKLSPFQKEKVLFEAIDAVETTQFIYGQLGMSPYLQVPGLRNFTTLVTFPAKQAQFLVQQMKDDPTGLTRYLALSGFVTRLNRDAALLDKNNVGLDVSNAFGFGFIPEDIGPAPLFGPEVNLGFLMAEAYTADNPRDKKRLMNEMAVSLGTLVSGFVGQSRFAPLAAIPIPREVTKDISQRVQFPQEIDQNLGSRFSRGWTRYFQQMGNWELRGPNNDLIRPQTQAQALAQAGGFRTEAQREFQAEVDLGFSQRGEARFDVEQKLKDFSDASFRGDSESAQRAFDQLTESDHFLVFQMMEGSINQILSREIIKPYIDMRTRMLLSQPGLMGTPEGQLLLKGLEGQQ